MGGGRIENSKKKLKKTEEKKGQEKERKRLN